MGSAYDTNKYNKMPIIQTTLSRSNSYVVHLNACTLDKINFFNSPLYYLYTLIHILSTAKLIQLSIVEEGLGEGYKMGKGQHTNKSILASYFSEVELFFAKILLSRPFKHTPDNNPSEVDFDCRMRGVFHYGFM